MLRAEDFNIPFSTSDRTRQKISKDIEENNDQQDLIDIFRTLHPITEELQSFHTLTEYILVYIHLGIHLAWYMIIDCILGHKISLNELKTDIIKSFFFEHNRRINNEDKKRNQ